MPGYYRNLIGKQGIMNKDTESLFFHLLFAATFVLLPVSIPLVGCVHNWQINGVFNRFPDFFCTDI